MIAHSFTGACEGSYVRTVFLARHTLEVCKDYVGDSQWRGVLEAQCEIALSVALRDFDGIVDVVNEHGVVSDIIHTAISPSTLQVTA